MKRDAHPQSLSYIIFWASRKGAPPLQVPLTEFPQKEIFQSQSPRSANSQLPADRSPSPGPPTGPYGDRHPSYPSLKVPGKRAPFQVPHRERCPVSRAPFQLPVRVPGERTPHDTQKGPCGERCPSPEPSQGPVDEPSTKFPSRAPTESVVRPLSPPPHILPDGRKGARLTELPQRDVLPFRSPSTIS